MFPLLFPGDRAIYKFITVIPQKHEQVLKHDNQM